MRRKKMKKLLGLAAEALISRKADKSDPLHNAEWLASELGCKLKDGKKLLKLVKQEEVANA